MGISKKIWFFDNSMSNAVTKSHNKEQIHFIKIDESARYNDKIHSKYLEENSLQRDSFLLNENMDLKSGVTQSHFDELFSTIKSNKVEAVVFDWDRTLTKIEGFFRVTRTPGNDKFRSVREYRNKLNEKHSHFFTPWESWTDREFVEYLFHSPLDKNPSDRFNMLSKNLQNIQKKGIPIFILTNNPIIKLHLENRCFFQNMMEILGVFIPENHIFYAPHNIGKPVSMEYMRRKEDVIVDDIKKILEEDKYNRNSKRKTRKRPKHTQRRIRNRNKNRTRTKYKYKQTHKLHKH
jgi:hypothetical protein